MESREVSSFTFEQYIKLVDKYVDSDWREINFQNRIILPLLEYIFSNDNSISIVDVSTQYKNKETNIHTRKNYAGEYTPDLLIAKNWNYHNKSKNDIEYLAVVEVKSPVLDPQSNEKAHTNSEVKDYLSLGRKVVLTDCYNWHFYEPNTDKPGEIQVRSFSLRNGNEYNSTNWGDLINEIREFVFTQPEES